MTSATAEVAESPEEAGVHKRSEHLRQRSATPVETVQTVIGALGLVLEDAQE